MHTRSIASYFIIGISILLLFLFAAGAFWKSEHNPFYKTTSAPFPERTAERFSRSLEAIFGRPELVDSYKKTLLEMESTKDGHNIVWTQHEYSVRLKRPSRLSHLLKEISAAIEAEGGEVFQTYIESDNHQASVVVGVGSVITHHLVVRWPAAVVAKATPTPQAPAEPEAPSGFRAAIIIDDLGSSPSFVQSLLNLEVDLTYSILPHLEKSAEIASLLHEKQQEMLLHLPMEPGDYPKTSPGKGAILSQMTREEIQQTIDRNLETVPFAVGVNNHMGSELTANHGQMKAVLQHLRERRLFFVDSRTSGATVGYSLAQQLGVKSAQRKVFLDNVQDVKAVKAQLEELAALAEQGVPAIAIGHPKGVTLTALQEMLPEFEARNIKIVRVSEFIE